MQAPYCKHLRILAVDDEHEVRRILREMISHLGHTVITASDGLEALEKLTENHIDIVITDINMPHMDGIQLIKKSRLI